MTKAKPRPNQACPCGSGEKLERCCRPFHRGAPAPTPEALMRSRYTAYALCEIDYVLDTTHPSGPHHLEDRAAWADDVRGFCERTLFEGLELLDTKIDADEGWVTFRAQLSQRGADASFTERSRFLRSNGRWLYHSGQSY